MIPQCWGWSSTEILLIYKLLFLEYSWHDHYFGHPHQLQFKIYPAFIFAKFNWVFPHISPTLAPGCPHSPPNVPHFAPSQGRDPGLTQRGDEKERCFKHMACHVPKLAYKIHSTNLICCQMSRTFRTYCWTFKKSTRIPNPFHPTVLELDEEKICRKYPYHWINPTFPRFLLIAELSNP